MGGGGDSAVREQRRTIGWSCVNNGCTSRVHWRWRLTSVFCFSQSRRSWQSSVLDLRWGLPSHEVAKQAVLRRLSINPAIRSSTGESEFLKVENLMRTWTCSGDVALSSSTQLDPLKTSPFYYHIQRFQNTDKPRLTDHLIGSITTTRRLDAYIHTTLWTKALQ